MRAISLARSARRRLKLDPPILDASGRLDAGDAAAARRIAAQVNRERRAAAASRAPAPGGAASNATAGEASVEDGPPAAPSHGGGRGPSEPTFVAAGDLIALAALGAVLHRVVQEERGTSRLDAAADRARQTVGSEAVSRIERAWAQEFGGADQQSDIRGQTLGSATGARGTTAAEPDLPGELLVLAALNDDPAAAPLRELVDDRPLRRSTDYARLVAALERELAAGTASAPKQPSGRASAETRPASLPDRLREPMRRAPDSLQAQLQWIREHWSALLAADPALAERVALALDVLAEEARAFELAAGAAARATAFGGPVPAEAPDYRGLDAEPEAFSVDEAWMPRLVLVAKSTYVWLEQLSQRYGRWIRTLADIPDEELDRLSDGGISGLWLIGLWQRSGASAEIKRRRGDSGAVASAYSVDEYRIADDLGGEAAYEDLRVRASARGIRMAADMVPNHMGLDSRWVLEHPERFISLDAAPFPAYSFGGPNLSPDPAVDVTIEDHYWDSTDAAVVFRRRQVGGPGAGQERFVYHGNDGTSFPWNDTAQLDYLRPDVREAVIGTILDVARRAPIIRFDAAMVLARRHIRRLWYPRPGEGGAIPSRAEH
ncbi:MAG TPA: alpha-amylase family glycosyl hydrolase, partial [Candidatus Binatus sp.]|nr:alpha-amylase family glycosyl hydrolase [Candidatus Binatus sp.]